MSELTDCTSSDHTGKQEIILIRHGQSTANASGVWQGQKDFPLSEVGRRQAVTAGRVLKGKRISSVYASPLERAIETAEIVAREVGFSGEVIALPGLTERHGGILEGHTWSEQEARDPEFVKRFLTLPEEKRWAFAGAETDEEILARFEKAFSDIRLLHPVDDGGASVVISHGGIMRAFLREHFGPSVLPGSERAPNASITRLLYDPANPGCAPQLLELASKRHLSQEEEHQAQTRGE